MVIQPKLTIVVVIDSELDLHAVVSKLDGTCPLLGGHGEKGDRLNMAKVVVASLILTFAMIMFIACKSPCLCWMT